MIDKEAAYILDQGITRGYEGSLAAVTLIAKTRLADINPAAAHVLLLCSYLAPEPILATWIHQSANLYESGSATDFSDLGDLPKNALETSRAFALIRDKGLGRVDVNGLRLHRLTQAILRDHTCAREGAFRTLVAAALAAAAPKDTDKPAYWSDWARLVPHLLSAIPHSETYLTLRVTACNLARYLIVSGQTKAAATLTDQLRARVRVALADPECAHVRERDDLEQLGGTLPGRIHNALNHLKELRDVPGVQVSLHQVHLYSAVYRFDEQMIVTPYLYRARGYQHPALHLRRLSPHGIFTRYADQFEQIWGTAKRLPSATAG